MHFDLVDNVLELNDEGIVTLKNVSAAEEYLQDHFPTFPVLPGVLMIEALVQAARRWLESRQPGTQTRYVLGAVRALKYGAFVRPGEAMRVRVTPAAQGDDGSFEFKGTAEVIRHGDLPGAERPTSVSGRFTLRPVRLSVDFR